MADLFRSQVIERQTNRLHGDVLILPRLSHLFMLGFILLWVAAALGWLLTSTYTNKETVFGWLEPPQGIARVYGEDAGIIKQVLVKEGEQVWAGQALLIINGERFMANGERLDNRLLAEYQAQERLLNEQLEHTTTIYQRRAQDSHEQIVAGEQDLNLLAIQLATMTERLELIEQQSNREKALQSRRLIASTEVDKTTIQMLSLHNEQQALQREQLNRRNAISQLKTQLELLPNQRANDLSQMRAQLSDVAQNIAQLAGQHAFLIRAPGAGVVNNLQAREGQQVAAGSRIPLLTIRPANLPLAVHLLVPVRAVGFVAPGQALDIRYDAFPYQKFGLYAGEIVSISDTVLLPNEVLNTPLKVEEPVYQITASLVQPTVQAYGKNFALKPGMTLSADVRLSERTLLQWLLEPLYTLRGRI